MLDALPEKRFWWDEDIARIVARPQGKDDQDPAASASAATMDQGGPASAPAQGVATATPTAAPPASGPSAVPASDDDAQQEPLDLTRTDAFDQYAQTVAAKQAAGHLRRSEIRAFEWYLERTHEFAKRVAEILPLAVEVCTPLQARTAKDIIAVWTDVVEGAAQRREKPTGVDTDDDSVQPFTG